MPEREIPRSQQSFSDLTLSRADTYAFALKKRLLEIQPESVKIVTDLYCGNGVLTIGAIELFPHAQIHAVDYHDVLVPDAKKHSRVTFHQGWVDGVLASGAIPKSDVVLMSFASRHHGFTEQNISLLSSIVGNVLLTMGDNAGLENEPWFRERFQFIAGGAFIEDYSLWRVG